MQMDERDVLNALAEIEAQLDRWKAESSDPHTLVACEDAIRYVIYAYDTIKELT